MGALLARPPSAGCNKIFLNFSIIYIDDDNKLIQEHLLTLEPGIYGSSEYLQEFGAPQTPEDLDCHRLVVFARPEENPYAEVNWILKVGRRGGKPRKVFYTSKSIHNYFEAAQRGSGLITTYQLMQDNTNSNLVRVLESVKGPSYKQYIIYPEKPGYIDRIQLLKAFLMENINKNTRT